jgi:DNA-binding MarR family transcriptional regulator
LRENRQLKLENENLKKQLQNARPKGDELSQITATILKAFFDNARELSSEEVSRHFGLEQSIAGYHLDILLEKKLIWQSGYAYSNIIESRPATYEITTKGRKHVVESGWTG